MHFGKIYLFGNSFFVPFWQARDRDGFWWTGLSDIEIGSTVVGNTYRWAGPGGRRRTRTVVDGGFINQVYFLFRPCEYLKLLKLEIIDEYFLHFFLLKLFQPHDVPLECSNSNLNQLHKEKYLINYRSLALNCWRYRENCPKIFREYGLGSF